MFVFSDALVGKTLICKATNATFPDFTEETPLEFEVTLDKKTSISETEAGAIPDLYFRAVYPNPSKNRIINANIMCYLQDISNVELGLYNYLGQKIMDLSNSFEYSESAKTILLNFEVPKNILKGSYYLNVRNGNETRTKGIVIED
jgi:hypothetical protein